jgi:hypothetical protein
MTQSITFNAAAVVNTSWDALKVVLSSKNLAHQYVGDGNEHVVFAVDGGATYFARLTDDDMVDFEAHFKATANKPLEVRAKDGRQTVRDSTANRMTTFKLRAVSFYSSTVGGAVHNMNPVTGLDYGDVTVTLYDASGNAITDPTSEASAVRTVIEWEPHYDYEIIGGYMDVPSSLRDGTSDAWFLSAIGVPDYPPAYFGSIDYISEVNLEAISTQRVVSDGRAVSFLPYNLGGAPHTNKLRFILKHPAGAKQRFQILVEHFTA